VGTILEEQGVIRSALAFRVLAGFRGFGSGLQAGRYQLTTNMPVEDVFDALAEGPIPRREVQLQIPEGLELREVAAAVEDQVGLDAKAFDRAATSGRYSLPPYLPQSADTVEGFLFPQTYSLPRRADVDDVIHTLLEEFDGEAADLPWEDARKLGVSPYEIVTIASMIEREARVDQDRAKISAVIYNRLRRDMPLEIDATVQYAIPGEYRILTTADLDYPSPYNTYLHPGLPPTPIASPGIESLRAALEPANVDYLYYLVVDPDTGRHGFFDTYEEFVNKKNQIQG
jgi:UPF0755 protein